MGWFTYLNDSKNKLIIGKYLLMAMSGLSIDDGGSLIRKDLNLKVY